MHTYKEYCLLIVTTGSFPFIYMEPRFQVILLHVSFQYGIEHFWMGTLNITSVRIKYIIFLNLRKRGCENVYKNKFTYNF